MKKFLSFIFAITMCLFSFSIVASAEKNTISFPMASNRGIITVTGENYINTFMKPDTEFNDSIIIEDLYDSFDITSVKLIIESERYGLYGLYTYEYNFVNYVDPECTIACYGNTHGDYWKLNVETTSTYTGLNPLIFDNIYSMKILVSGSFETDSSEVYYDWGTNITYDYTDIFVITKDFTYGSNVTNAIRDLVDGCFTLKYNSKMVKNDYPFLSNTDFNSDGIITKNEIMCLSYSRLGEGKGIYGFEGLASQVSNFFNKQTNGTITFKVTNSIATSSNVWAEGGIPSTQTGFPLSSIKSMENAIGLFFNYETTGTLMTASRIDDEGNIVFDISEILEDIGTNSLASVRSIYYGLVGGINYADMGRGIKVYEVVLSYEKPDETTVTTVITTSPEIITTEPEVEVIDDEDEDTTSIYVDDEDDEVIIDDDDEIITEITATTDEEVIIEDDIVETTTEDITPIAELIIETPIETDDENPKTGVSIAIVPALISLAVGIYSRKRK